MRSDCLDYVFLIRVHVDGFPTCNILEKLLNINECALV